MTGLKHSGQVAFGETVGAHMGGEQLAEGLQVRSDLGLKAGGARPDY